MLETVSEVLENSGCTPLFSKILKNQFNQITTLVAEKDTRLAEKDTRLAEKDTMTNKLIAEKDARLAEKDTLVASKDNEILTYVQDLSRYKLLYAWRGTLDWYVRVIYPSSQKSSSGSLWKDLVKEDITKNASIVEKVLGDVQPHFPVSAQVLAGIRGSFIDVYAKANGVMHRSPEIEQEKGLCCGGVDLENMATAAATVLFLQRSCIRRRIPIPPELNEVAVLNPSFNSVHGKCIDGAYVIRPP